MAKRGRKKSMKRIAAPKAIPIYDKKASRWITRACPGPHSTKQAMPLEVLLRDVLKVCRTAREVKRVLSGRLVLVDGRVRAEPRFPVGLMDVVSMPKAGTSYRLVLDRKGRLAPMELKEGTGSKIAKVTGKRVVPGGKIAITLHDGRNMLSDNHIRVGDSVVLKVPEGKLEGHLKLEKGCRCLIREGKHAGTIAKLEEIIPRAAGKPFEAKVKAEKGDEFITVARYLFVVDGAFRGVAE